MWLATWCGQSVSYNGLRYTKRVRYFKLKKKRVFLFFHFITSKGSSFPKFSHFLCSIFSLLKLFFFHFLSPQILSPLNSLSSKLFFSLIMTKIKIIFPKGKKGLTYTLNSPTSDINQTLILVIFWFSCHLCSTIWTSIVRLFLVVWKNSWVEIKQFMKNF